MEINELQKQVKELLKKIDSKQKGNHDTETTFVHLIEEIGEVSRQLYNEKIGRDELDKKNIKEELSDVLMLVLQLANNFNIDLEQEVKNKILKLKERAGVE